MTAVVGVWFPDATARRAWLDELRPVLSDLRVVDAVEEPSEVEVVVVGNPPGDELHHLPKLRFVQSAWAGVDRLVEGPPPVPIARLVAPQLTELMTEFVIAAALYLHRDFPAYARSQARAEWTKRRTQPARKRSVGVLGFGELGRPAARALSGLGFEVSAWARSSRRAEVPVLSGEEGFYEVLGRSEILVNLLPLTPATRGVIDRRALAALPAGAGVVNAARGGHVVESDLLEALDAGSVSHAVLDVFEEEPLPAGHPFWAHEQVTVLPHVAAPSDPSDLAPLVADNVRSFLGGAAPRFLIERSAGDL